MATISKVGRSRADLQKAISESKLKFKSNSLEAMKKIFTPSYYLDTGSAMLNIMFCGRYDGGLPNTISLQLVGPKDSGKSLIGMLLCAAADNEEFVIDFFESEGAALYDKIVALGIDPNYFNFCDVPHIKALGLAINERVNFYELEDKALIYVDSIGNMPSSEEYEKAKRSDQTDVMGKRAKETNSMFRIILKDASRRHTPLIFVNRQYSNMDSNKYTPEEDKMTTAGGTSNDYSPSITICMNKKVIKKEVTLRRSDGEKTGTKMVPEGTKFFVRADKNRITRTGNKIELYVDEVKGMIRFHDVISYAEEFGYATRVVSGRFNPERTFKYPYSGWNLVKSKKYSKEVYKEVNDIPDEAWSEAMDDGLNAEIYNNYFKLPDLQIKFNKQWNDIKHSDTREKIKNKKISETK